MAVSTAHPSPRAADDRRRSDRRPYESVATVISPTATNPAERIDVTAVNLSKHGLAFETANALTPGVYLKIELALNPQRLYSEIRVVACRRLPTGRHEIGAEFC